MKILEEFKDFINRESKTRTKLLNDGEFLRTLKENCKNFSFENDMLWRKTNNFGEYGFFYESERIRTIGNYSYKDFFDDRKEYPVPRYKSLIGSTTKEGADLFGSESTIYLVIPFDDSNLIFSCSPDLVLISRRNQIFSDSLFLLRKYVSDFKVPEEELFDIMSRTNIADFKNIFVSKKLGFEFFTNSNCLMLRSDKIDWLKENLK